MKTNHIKIALIIISFFTFFSCSKDSSDENRFEGTMEAKINGELVTFHSAWGDGSYNLDEGCIEPFYRVFGTWEEQVANGHTVILNFYPSQGLGTYNPVASYSKWEEFIEPLWYNSATYYQNHFDVETQTHFEEVGEVTITSTANNRYKGTFYFTAVNENGDAIRLGFPEIFVITDGKFEIPQRVPLSCD